MLEGADHMSKIDFHLVITNRDFLKVNNIKIPVWEFFDRPLYNKLTSLEYCPPLQPIPGRVFYDCGAWSYRNMNKPKFTVDECLEMYQRWGKRGDMIAAPDHIVLPDQDEDVQQYRIKVTLDNAKEFIGKCPNDLTPIACNHGIDIETRRMMTREYLNMGYKRIAIGGVAGRAGRLKTKNGYTPAAQFLLDIIKMMEEEGVPEIHVLGIGGNLAWVEEYMNHPVVKSFDSAAVYKSAFSAGHYYWVNEKKPNQLIKYKAIREKNAPNDLPLCNCKACTIMRGEGHDTRTYGSNENNMGRAVHNVNMFLRSLELMNIDWGKHA